MKITFTIELDKESTEIFRTPFNKIAEQISGFMKMSGNPNVTIQDKPIPEENTKSSNQPDIETKKEETQSKKNQDGKAKKSKISPRKSAALKKPKKNVSATILNTIKKNKQGINSENLKKKTGFNAKQITDNVYRLKRAGLIQKTGEGVFIVA